MPRVQRAALSVPSRVPNMLRLLPFHRPASPELKLSPSATIAVVDDAGPAFAAGATTNSAAASAIAKAATFVPLIRPPSPIVCRGPPQTPRGANIPDGCDRYPVEQPE